MKNIFLILSIFILTISSTVADSHNIKKDGFLIKWINGVAYSMVAAVMMMILVYPSGVLSSTMIEHRLIALAIGVLVMIFLKKLLYAILISMVCFALLVNYS